MTNRALSINADQAIGLLGLFLMLAVARLANRGVLSARGVRPV